MSIQSNKLELVRAQSPENAVIPGTVTILPEQAYADHVSAFLGSQGSSVSESFLGPVDNGAAITWISPDWLNAVMSRLTAYATMSGIPTMVSGDFSGCAMDASTVNALLYSVAMSGVAYGGMVTLDLTGGNASPPNDTVDASQEVKDVYIGSVAFVENGYSAFAAAGFTLTVNAVPYHFYFIVDGTGTGDGTGISIDTQSLYDANLTSIYNAIYSTLYNASFASAGRYEASYGSYLMFFTALTAGADGSSLSLTLDPGTAAGLLALSFEAGTAAPPANSYLLTILAAHANNVVTVN